MSVTGYMLVSVVFTNIPQLAPYASYRYPVGFLFGLTSNVSIPIVLKWFQQQITKKLNEVGKKKWGRWWLNKNKKNFAKDGRDGRPNLLIDDHLQNCQEFKKAGGLGVHHKSASKTISELKNIGYKW